MRIAQVSPLHESVPPKLYGGTERVVSYLTEELVRRGHDVTLFASGDSQTSAKLYSACDASLRLKTDCIDQLAHHFFMLEKVFQLVEDDAFDIVHFHVDYLHFIGSRRLQFSHVTTMHGRLDLTDIVSMHQEFDDMPLVSISMAQRLPLNYSNWVGNVYHGLPEEQYSFTREPGRYLAFLGRISPEKRLDRAIAIAKKVGLPLKIAAKVDQSDKEYFKTQIIPLLDHPLVEYIGEIDERAKPQFLGNALALLFPIDWPEPFGLVMIEAMACGTPVIAFKNGSVPEILTDGVTGFIVEDIEGAVRAVDRLGRLDRRQCRAEFEERFSASRMADAYLSVYEEQIEYSKRTLNLGLGLHG